MRHAVPEDDLKFSAHSPQRQTNIPANIDYRLFKLQVAPCYFQTDAADTPVCFHVSESKLDRISGAERDRISGADIFVISSQNEL